MGLDWDGVFREGCPADFMVLQARTGYELITPSGRKRRVYRAGTPL
jgi:cytosine/adenosine deaminase-related metal-dependent hydrolase